MYCNTWFHTTGLVIRTRNRSITVGLISRLSLTERHWNWKRPEPPLLMLARLALTDW